jgi:hypothetical protein
MPFGRGHKPRHARDAPPSRTLKGRGAPRAAGLRALLLLRSVGQAADAMTDS